MYIRMPQGPSSKPDHDEAQLGLGNDSDGIAKGVGERVWPRHQLFEIVMVRWVEILLRELLVSRRRREPLRTTRFPRRYSSQDQPYAKTRCHTPPLQGEREREEKKEKKKKSEDCCLLTKAGINEHIVIVN
jgi:hypothetical protein